MRGTKSTRKPRSASLFSVFVRNTRLILTVLRGCLHPIPRRCVTLLCYARLAVIKNCRASASLPRRRSRPQRSGKSSLLVSGRRYQYLIPFHQVGDDGGLRHVRFVAVQFHDGFVVCLMSLAEFRRHRGFIIQIRQRAVRV